MMLNLRNNSGGALLAAIIAAFLLSFTSAALIMLTTNQAMIMDKEGNRLQAKNMTKAGVMHAFSMLLAGDWNADESPYSWNGMDIFIEEDNNLSDYKIRVVVNY